MGVGALHTVWNGFDDCNYSPTLWHSTQWKTTIRQLLFLTADTNDVHTNAAHFVIALFTLEVHFCRQVCEGRGVAVVCICGIVYIIQIYAHCKSLFKHTVMYIVVLPLSSGSHMEMQQDPWDGSGLALRAHRRTYTDISGFWMKPWIGTWETGMQFSVLSLCLFRLSNSLHHISPLLQHAKQRPLDMVLLQWVSLSLQKVFKLTED